ncbi:MAG: hypothetical protein OQK52_01605 [Ignavibacteriaceae bacterium]|nr:hypothetical protein [Ignavibacteriaceae bacterium]
MLKYFLICYLLTVSVSFGQTDTISNRGNYTFKPRIAGGQIEGVIMWYDLGFGGLVDIDLLASESKNSNSLGLRLALEYYFIFSEIEDGPFTDYCCYGRYTTKMNDFWISFLGGISYHDFARDYDDKLLFRTGLEFKYNLFRNYSGLSFKVLTSFQEQTTYFGIGIFIGYFE